MGLWAFVPQIYKRLPLSIDCTTLMWFRQSKSCFWGEENWKFKLILHAFPVEIFTFANKFYFSTFYCFYSDINLLTWLFPFDKQLLISLPVGSNSMWSFCNDKKEEKIERKFLWKKLLIIKTARVSISTSLCWAINER